MTGFLKLSGGVQFKFEMSFNFSIRQKIKGNLLDPMCLPTTYHHDRMGSDL